MHPDDMATLNVDELAEKIACDLMDRVEYDGCLHKSSIIDVARKVLAVNVQIRSGASVRVKMTPTPQQVRAVQAANMIEEIEALKKAYLKPPKAPWDRICKATGKPKEMTASEVLMRQKEAQIKLDQTLASALKLDQIMADTMDRIANPPAFISEAALDQAIYDMASKIDKR
jgi:hypothetical protein